MSRGSSNAMNFSMPFCLNPSTSLGSVAEAYDVTMRSGPLPVTSKIAFMVGLPWTTQRGRTGAFGARSKPSGDALERRRLASKREGRGWVHAVHHGRRHQDRGPPLLGGFVDDVHRPKLQGGGVVGINLGGLNELARDLGFSRSKDHTGLLLALRLGLARHGILQSDRDRDVSDLHRPDRHAPIGCLLPYPRAGGRQPPCYPTAAPRAWRSR